MADSKYVILLDAGHCKSTPGKKSPDGELREYKYTREILESVENELDKLGISHWNTHPEEDFVIKVKGTFKSLDSRDLVLRTNRINSKIEDLKKEGKKAVLVSIHVNAAGNGGWKNARGWSVWTTKGQNVSDKFADKFCEAAHEVLEPIGQTVRKDKSDGDEDYESDFWILKKSNCPCVLIENFFMDNEKDVKFLLSNEGRKAVKDIIIKGIQKYIS